LGHVAGPSGHGRGPRGKKERGGGFPFFLSFFFSFIPKLFSHLFKNILNHLEFFFDAATHLNKINARACMLNHIANSYDNF
jgi:hypothetical protein